MKNKKGRLPEHLKPYLKITYRLQDQWGTHLYDENFEHFFTIPPSDEKPSPDIPQSIFQMKKGDDSKTEAKLTQEAIVDIIIGKFKYALNAFHIKADYFVQEKLGPLNAERFLRVYKGKIDKLNKETEEGFKSGDYQQICGGLNTLKASLIHELYINSTLAGRSFGEEEGTEPGRNMKGLLTFQNLLKKDGTLNEKERDLSKLEQKNFIDFFGRLESRYMDKKDVIVRVYQKIKYDFGKGLLTFKKEKISFDKFKAIMIYKLYENTNRLDRGNGISMIGLVKDIFDIKLKK